jgi:inner membrane protein
VPRRVWASAAVCAVLPDIDVVGSAFGIAYGDLLGHRGLTHSLPFAAVLATGVVRLGFAGGVPGLSARALWLFLFIATASHGLLDALTDGGLGVGFLAPFTGTRYFFPLRPIRVASVGVRDFLARNPLEVLGSEVVWVWAPTAVVAALGLAWRRASTRDTDHAGQVPGRTH